MKKIILILSLLVVFAANQAQSQTWAPDGAEWYYGYESFWYSGYVHINVIGDSIIHDTTCRMLDKRIVIRDLILDTTYTAYIGREYMYSKNGKVYIYANGKFSILYDFTAAPGDTLTIPQNEDLLDWCDSVGHIQVIDTGSTIINGQLLKRMEVMPVEGTHWAIYGEIIETIGTVHSYMLPEPDWACVVDVYEGGRLRCYSDPDFGLYSTGISPECDYLVSVPEYSEEQFKVFPNPCEGVLNIHTPEELTGAELSIYNNMGKRVAYKASLSPQATIDLAGLPQGIYCITIKMGNYFANQLIVMK